jgi:hypothetical protein
MVNPGHPVRKNIVGKGQGSVGKRVFVLRDGGVEAAGVNVEVAGGNECKAADGEFSVCWVKNGCRKMGGF